MPLRSAQLRTRGWLPHPSRACAPSRRIRSSAALEDLGEVLVAAPGQADGVELTPRVRQDPRERMRGLERGNDPPNPRALAKCGRGAAAMNPTEPAPPRSPHQPGP